ncbi:MULTISPECIES: GNAT family N-acetyltransferase [unclassified Bacillus (in: firmicutes)]|uniref:GNAT family N-acetyltransferase n=1 Tax=unclassified Bacillus (in: firmicutes) TaxID=185979 RepID=UPI001BE61976|nr:MULTISPECIES: GNAT family N-acetyltransferase [unclassified Bacillus (in: firmicutes)]MBT2639530.1 GNAT family N-acetyltransferase [Bacillus sp. ISL-39]MBT2662534.1 GNAT family N-acetyltransferase [Bacillus sp. ISL-45]
MLISEKGFNIKGLNYKIRSAVESDAEALSELRLQIDGETENLDREQGEAFIDQKGFQSIIKADTESPRNIFLVAETNGRLIGFSRCAGNELKRFRHKVEFGVGILKEFWGYGIGKNLLLESISWADENEIKKITLHVMETNESARRLYEKLGFEVEGVLKNDKLLSDGNFYNMVVMGRLKNGMEG